MSDVPPQQPPTGGQEPMGYPPPGQSGPPAAGQHPQGPPAGQAPSPPPGWGPPPPPDYGVPGYASATGGEPGFLGALFDTSFSSFVTTRLVKAIYVLVMIVVALVAVIQLIAALVSGDGGVIVLSLLFVPLFALLTLIWARVGLELVIVVFRIGEDTRRTADALSRNQPG
jgi:hypothetical protein